MFERDAAPQGHTAITDLLQNVLVKHADNWCVEPSFLPSLSLSSVFSLFPLLLHLSFKLESITVDVINRFILINENDI